MVTQKRFNQVLYYLVNARAVIQMRVVSMPTPLEMLKAENPESDAENKLKLFIIISVMRSSKGLN